MCPQKMPEPSDMNKKKLLYAIFYQYNYCCIADAFDWMQQISFQF
jgi:hypothetical protein